MRVLLTGAGGFIGSSLLKLLEGEDLQLRACYRSVLAPVLLPRIESFRGDLCDEALCQRLTADVDVIVHLAGQAHVHGTKGSHVRNTYEISSKLVQAAIRNRVRDFIYISSTRANFPRHSAYAAIKLATERMLLEHHGQGLIRISCLRPSLVYGPGMRGNLAKLLSLLRHRYLPCFPGSEVPIGMIGLEDCCRAILCTLRDDKLSGRCWELNDGQYYTLNRLVGEVRGYLGFPGPLLQLPEFIVKSAAKFAEISAPLTGTSVGMGTYRALYEEPYQRDDGFARQTGFAPQQSFFSQLPLMMEYQQ